MNDTDDKDWKITTVKNDNNKNKIKLQLIDFDSIATC